MIKMGKKFIILFIILLSWNSVFAYDEVLQYDFSGLWDLNDPLYEMPYNLTTFTVTKASNVNITYNGFDCENNNDFYIYINGTTINIPCSWNYDNGYNIESWIWFLQTGTYEIYVNKNVSDTFGIWELNINMTYDTTLNNTGVWYDENYKKVGFFIDFDEFIEFAFETAVLYMIALLLVMVVFLWEAFYIWLIE